MVDAKYAFQYAFKCCIVRNYKFTRDTIHFRVVERRKFFIQLIDFMCR
ncbi:hypothetical protein AGR1C_Lc80206 [Agrobacterium fabacearum TT111]|nr:hypothetical protein AGR1C_Lc80206 [Agrobacterium fabacearum TT111]